MKQAWQARIGGVLLAAAWAGAALAQAGANQGSIYACTDAKGRRITADRPIADCVDREQRVLGNTGVELRRQAVGCLQRLGLAGDALGWLWLQGQPRQKSGFFGQGCARSMRWGHCVPSGLF